MRILKPALIYFAFVFAAGFIFGVLRVLWVIPQLGTRTAELLEMPLMLIAIVLGASWIDRHTDSAESPTRLSIGLIALALLLLAEVAVGVGLRGLSVGASLVNPDPVSGTIYYAMLGVFALMPWLLALRKAT
jgi:hypothetical protein